MTAAGAKPRPAGAPSFALALGGGGARGLAHIHVLEVLDEMGIRPVAIAGSSIGAIMGAAYAAGMTGKDIRDYATAVLSKPAEVAARLWQARPATLKEQVKRSFRIGQFDVERILAAFMPPQVPKTFAELSIPLTIAATDYFGRRLHVMKDGDLISAIGASAALPAVFEPVQRDGRLLVDGGLFNPVPFDLLRGTADVIIAVDVVGAPQEDEKAKPKTIDLLYSASQLMMHAIIDNKLAFDRPDIFLRPPVSRFRVLDFMKMDAIMRETASIRDDLARGVEQAISARAKS